MNGKREGPGTFSRPDGNRFSGIWRDIYTVLIERCPKHALALDASKRIEESNQRVESARRAPNQDGTASTTRPARPSPAIGWAHA